jgi:membrane protein implicated in regulation of membrane protease activity
MSIGAGILLVAVGAILTFAVNWQLGGLDLDIVGWVLMIAGLAGIVITVMYSRRRGTRVVEQQVQPGAPVVERRTQVYDDPNVPPPPV